MVATISKTHAGLRVLLAAGALGLPAAVVLREGPWGIGFPFWISALLVTAFFLARSIGVKLSAGSIGFGLAAIALSGWLAVRDSEPLRAMNIGLVLFCLGVVGLRSVRGFEWRASLFDLGLRAPGRIFEWVAEPFLLVGQDIKWRAIGSGSTGQGAMAMTRGVLISVPVLLIFGGLFASADKNFSAMFDHLDLVTALPYAATWFAGTWASGAFYRQVLIENPLPPDPLNELAPSAEAIPNSATSGEIKTNKPLGLTEVSVVLGLTNLLFIVFGLLQVRYLFGNTALVHNPGGPSFAEYAKRGFFELVAVAGLTLPLLIGAKSVLARVSEDRHPLFKALAASLIGLVFVTMASAATRLSLYMDAYGLTQGRLYGAAFLVWLGLTFIWFACTLLRGRDPFFAFGAAVSMLVVGFGLNVLNPDLAIARMNLRKSQTIDYGYIASLSADAAPAIRAARPGFKQDVEQVFRDAFDARLEARSPVFGAQNLALLAALGSDPK